MNFLADVSSYSTSTRTNEPSRHYYANGQRLATRTPDALYYLLGDPLGTTTVIADENGDEVGHILYDSFGEVVENTIDPALAEQLVSHLDTGLGLQFDGYQYYDPLVGINLQPETPGALASALNGLNTYGPTDYLTIQAASSGIAGRNRHQRQVAQVPAPDFLASFTWWSQQVAGQGIGLGARALSAHSLVRFSVSYLYVCTGQLGDDFFRHSVS